MLLGYFFLVPGSLKNRILSEFRMPVLNVQMLSFPLFSPFKLDSAGLTLELL